MENEIKKSDSPKLQVGDKIACKEMDDIAPVPTGMIGTVTRVSQGPGNQIIYEVKWMSGSRLSLLDGVDKWTLVKRAKTENSDMENLDENVLFVIKKGSLLKEIKRKKY
jgi:hypothetical protein